MGETRSGEAALRTALRRWRHHGGRGLGDRGRETAPAPRRWWPRLTAPQVQALLGMGITLALLLWDQLRQHFGK